MADILVYGKQEGGGRLPAGYQELEYIESEANAYIDTGFKPNQDTKWEYSFKCNNLTDSVMAGSRNKYGNKMYVLGCTFAGSVFGAGYGNTTDYPGVVTTDTNSHIFIIDKNKWYFDGELRATMDVFTFQGDYNMFLFRGNNGGSPTNTCYQRVYYSKIWDNGTLIRNLIPAKRLSDNAVGMHDLVSNTFFTNSGTGSFIAGPVVSGGYLTKEVATEVMIKHSNLLENTVTFKVEDADYQIVSVKSGNAVSKPAEYNYWKDINENVITFPYTPTSDITLYRSSRIPAGYQEVEYLQSSGTQYIDTGYQVYYFSSTNENVSKTDIEISVNWDETSGQTYQGYGIGSGKNVIPYMGPDNVGLSTRQWTVGSTTSFVKPVGSDADFFGSKHYLKFSGTTATGTIDNNSGNINLSQLTGGSATYWLFAYNAATIRYNKSRCYYCNIWNEGALVRYLIPCYRKSDSKPGMYDTVNNVFYTNQGSGDDFTVGPDVN